MPTGSLWISGINPITFGLHGSTPSYPLNYPAPHWTVPPCHRFVHMEPNWNPSSCLGFQGFGFGGIFLSAEGAKECCPVNVGFSSASFPIPVTGSIYFNTLQCSKKCYHTFLASVFPTHLYTSLFLHNMYYNSLQDDKDFLVFHEKN